MIERLIALNAKARGLMVAAEQGVAPADAMVELALFGQGSGEQIASDQQGQAAGDVVAVVLVGLLHRLRHEDPRGHVDRGVEVGLLLDRGRDLARRPVAERMVVARGDSA